jgi:hypothetical protein
MTQLEAAPTVPAANSQDDAARGCAYCVVWFSPSSDIFEDEDEFEDDNF